MLTRMRNRVVRYLKIAALSAAAFVLAACMRTGGANSPFAWNEPRTAEPPKSGHVERGALFESDGEANQIVVLEQRLAELNAEIAGIRAALREMGPLPPQDTFFIPGETLAPPAEGAFRLADLYAEPPLLAGSVSLFPASAEGEAGRRTNTLASYTRFDVADHGVLSSETLMSKPEVDALCVELSALAGGCARLPVIRATR